jgi:hypothetical protein
MEAGFILPVCRRVSEAGLIWMRVSEAGLIIEAVLVLYSDQIGRLSLRRRMSQAEFSGVA